MSENINKIIYINLNKRKDRREQLEKELNAFNLPYERFEAIENKEYGLVGCGQSHVAVLKLAKERGYENVLILEDDFIFKVSKDEFEEKLQKFFDLKLDYDVLMLVYNIWQPNKPTEHDFLQKIVNASNACAYLVNNKYYDKLIHVIEKNIPLLAKTREHWNYSNDVSWFKIQKTDNWYSFIKQIGRQEPLGSTDT